MRESVGLPVAWLFSWFSIAFVVYIVLGIWFWRSARHHDRTMSKGEEVPPAN